jgi:hypothetical protein
MYRLIRLRLQSAVKAKESILNRPRRKILKKTPQAHDRQGFFLKKLAICLTSNFIADFYEIDHGDSKFVMGPKKFGTEVTCFVTSSVIYK